MSAATASLLVVASLALYAAVGGAVLSLLESWTRRSGSTAAGLLEGMEPGAAAIWPVAPLIAALVGLTMGAFLGLRAAARLGGRVPGLLAALGRRAWVMLPSRRGPLHDDCAASWAWLSSGGDPLCVPHGPCVDCGRRISRRAGASLPAARALSRPST